MSGAKLFITNVVIIDTCSIFYVKSKNASGIQIFLLVVSLLMYYSI